MENVSKYDVIDEAANIVENIFNDYDITPITKLKALVDKYHNIKDSVDDETLESLLDDIEAAREINPYDVDIYEQLHEVIDGHEWVIYTYSAWQVMGEMRHDDITVNEFEQLSCGMDFTDIDSVAMIYTYSALYGHAMNELDNVLERYINDICDTLN